MLTPESRPSFPTTRWSFVLSTRDEDAEERRRAWEALAAAYWKPAFAYIRALGRSPEESMDLTQSLFVWMLESAFLERADPDRGRFRGLLKVSIKRFLLDEARYRNRQKRGGDQRVLSLDFGDGELPSVDPADLRGKSPEEILNLTWRNQVLTRAASILERRYREENRPTYYHVFRDYFLSDSEEPAYAELAKKHGLTVTNVNNYLVHAKHRYRAVLEELVAETVENPDDLREELAWLLAPE